VGDILKLNWDNVDFLVECLSDQIKSKKVNYDTIIALGRGGLIPGASLSYKLDIYNLYNLGISTREDDGKYLDTIVYQKPTDLNKNSKILVVDDINDSGRTFTAVNSILQSEYNIDSNNILYASLVMRDGSEFDKNIIFGNILYTSSWLVFPWDK
jgi:hypoxanthine phosphoribosyltransferase|tara:strand:- start:683 stop:1147 length:465 start_codon:yes stop_codon:yes gene_type:complete